MIDFLLLYFTKWYCISLLTALEASKEVVAEKYGLHSLGQIFILILKWGEVTSTSFYFFTSWWLAINSNNLSKFCLYISLPSTLLFPNSCISGIFRSLSKHVLLTPSGLMIKTKEGTYPVIWNRFSSPIMDIHTQSMRKTSTLWPNVDLKLSQIKSDQGVSESHIYILLLQTTAQIPFYLRSFSHINPRQKKEG